ncbi:MAG TPA: class I SAM-dependent methyltransferase [Solirubrobacteraceae bacterium]|nr:class I SAM-dependent methyltransferase [Solirubrobacteraceae bacterium]
MSDDWSARAEAWATHWARLAEPARAALLAAADVGPGTRLLDVGCGSGELCAAAAERGAVVAGIDAAEGMLAISRRRVPDGDLRVGAIETLPWADASFDVVTAVNALQFADDFGDALREAARVARPGGVVAVCNWARRADSALLGVFDRIDPPDAGSAPRPAIGEPGALEERARAAGLEPVAAAEVDVPWEAPDLATLVVAIVDGSGFDATPDTIGRAAAPFRRDDGSYRFENRFRYVIARA